MSGPTGLWETGWGRRKSGFCPQRDLLREGGAFFGPREPAESGLLGSVRFIAFRNE